MNKFVAFRVDGSLDTGIGHVKRCLTLAQKFMTEGYRIVFLSRSLTAELKLETAKARADLILLTCSFERDSRYSHSEWLLGTEDSDAQLCLDALKKYSMKHRCVPALIVVDHYALAQPWEKILSQIAPIFVIDDLCDRPHHCKWLMDQTIGRKEADYKQLINQNCQLLLGPQYALLRDEFYQVRTRSLQRRNEIQDIENILITLGGIDKNNTSLLVLKALEESSYTNLITLIIGASNPNVISLKNKIATSANNIRLIINSQTMSVEMLNADICIGAAGTTSWERCALGLPTINITIAKNQEVIARNLGKAGAAIEFGWLKDKGDVQRMISLINELKHKPEKLKTFTKKSALICDGMGVNRIYSLVTK